MKRSILCLSIAATVFALAPVVQARDHDHDHDRYSDELRSDVHSLWEWYGHLRDESNAHGSRHSREELEGIRGSIEHVDSELRDEHVHGDRVRGEIDGIRDELHHVSDELHWRGEVHHRSGFTIEFH